MVTVADFMQICVFSTRWHRQSYAEWERKRKDAKIFPVKYRSDEHITLLRLRPIKVAKVTKKDSLLRVIDSGLSHYGEYIKPRFNLDVNKYPPETEKARNEAQTVC